MALAATLCTSCSSVTFTEKLGVSERFEIQRVPRRGSTARAIRHTRETSLTTPDAPQLLYDPFSRGVEKSRDCFRLWLLLDDRESAAGLRVEGKSGMPSVSTSATRREGVISSCETRQQCRRAIGLAERFRGCRDRFAMR